MKYQIKKAEILDDDKMPLWDSFVSNHPRGQIYHTSLWRDLVIKAYGHKPKYFALLDSQEKIIAGFPTFIIDTLISGKRLSTIPCAQCCEPLVETHSQYDTLKDSVLYLIEKESIKSWELKVTSNFPYQNQKAVPYYEDYSTYYLNLEKDPQLLFENFHKSCIQRVIKKAERSRLVLKKCNNRSELEPFYKLYIRMRKQEGLLPQPRRFFFNLWDIMRPKGYIEVLYAELDGRIISTLMLLKFKNIATYEYGATEKGMYWTGASPFLIWNAIRDASIHGYRLFDFGRTSTEDIGLKTFKSRWGAHEVPFKYYSMSGAPGITALRKNVFVGHLMSAMMRSLPSEACQLIGRLTYRNLV